MLSGILFPLEERGLKGFAYVSLTKFNGSSHSPTRAGHPH